MYGSDPFAYDFKAALAGARSGVAKKGRTEEPTEADERKFYAAVPVFRYDADDFSFAGPDTLLGVGTLEPPTPAQLARHREKFEPAKYRGPSAEELRARIKARAAHREACEEIGRLYNLTGADVERLISDLRREGHSVPEISERAGLPEKRVRTLLRSP